MLRIAHLSDTHLGYSAYGRFTDKGMNQREVDVLKSFERTLEQIEAADPDLIVHSGDFFDKVRPSNATIIAAFRLMTAFQKRRSGRPFVIIGGNHDTPRSSESGNILRLFGAIEGIEVRPVDIQTFAIGDTEVCVAPWYGLAERKDYDWSPTLGKKDSVLIAHGMSNQVGVKIGRPGDFDVEELRAGRWTYVALGDYHSHTVYAANCCYSGSTDFTTTDIWSEASSPKGWVLFDEQIRFRPVETRKVLDLPVIDAAGLDPVALTDRIVKQATWTEDMPIVRQRVSNLMTEVRGRLSSDALREIQSRALSYNLVGTAPQRTASGSAQAIAAKPLEISWEEWADQAKLLPTIDRGEFKKTGLELMREARDYETVAVEA